MKLFLTIIVFCLAISSCKDFQSNDLAFDQNEWKKGDFRVRGRMYNDLFEQRLLHGRTRNEVIELLGKPDEEHKDFVKYAIELGSFRERWLHLSYFIIVVFDEKTQTVKYFGLIDS